MKRFSEILSAISVFAGVAFVATGVSYALGELLPWWVSVWGVVAVLAFAAYWLIELVSRKG